MLSTADIRLIRIIDSIGTVSDVRMKYSSCCFTSGKRRLIQTSHIQNTIRLNVNENVHGRQSPYPFQLLFKKFCGFANNPCDWYK